MCLLDLRLLCAARPAAKSWHVCIMSFKFIQKCKDVARKTLTKMVFLSADSLHLVLETYTVTLVISSRLHAQKYALLLFCRLRQD